MNSKEFPFDLNSSELEINDLEPTQAQLATLHEAIMTREVTIEPFDGIPQDITMENMSRMEIYSDGARYDESLTPSALYRTPDGRILWISVFRNPDTNAICKESITIRKPSLQYETYGEAETDSYTLTKNNEELFRLVINGSIDAMAPEVDYIQTLLDIAEPYNPFDM